MSIVCSASLKQYMIDAFWFSGLPSPRITPLPSGFAGIRTLQCNRVLRQDPPEHTCRRTGDFCKGEMNVDAGLQVYNDDMTPARKLDQGELCTAIECGITLCSSTYPAVAGCVTPMLSMKT